MRKATGTWIGRRDEEGGGGGRRPDAWAAALRACLSLRLMRRNSARLDLLASHSSCFLRFLIWDLERGFGWFASVEVLGSVALDSGLVGVSWVVVGVSRSLVDSLGLGLEAITLPEAGASSVGPTLRILDGRSSMSDILNVDWINY